MQNYNDTEMRGMKDFQISMPIPTFFFSMASIS